MKDGISLLSLKHHLLLSYLQSLILVSARRATGDSLTERTPASSAFSTVDRESRGSGAGDLVDSMIEGRIVLEKIKVLESRMRYQIEKLVRVAEEAPSGKDVVEGTFFFAVTNTLLSNTIFQIPSPFVLIPKISPTTSNAQTRSEMAIQMSKTQTAYTALRSSRPCPTPKVPPTSVPSDNPSPRHFHPCSTKIPRVHTWRVHPALARCHPLRPIAPARSSV
jgi:hypothetical protein